MGAWLIRRYLEAEGMERTYKFKQAAIKEHIDIQTERKMFDLDLDTFGPYRVKYDRAGRCAMTYTRRNACLCGCIPFEQIASIGYC